MQRCIICDYTVEEGSEFAYRAPGTSHVKEHDGDFLCDECHSAADENLSDLEVDDDAEG
jgi:hypothetical protein